jgi:predicted nucleotidyltransferase
MKNGKNKTIPEDIAPIIEELKVRLREFYGERLVKLVLFGSRARGDYESDSDIDILAVFRTSKEEAEKMPYPTDLIMDVLDRTDRLVTILEMDEESYQIRQGPLLRNIRREGVAVE